MTGSAAESDSRYGPQKTGQSGGVVALTLGNRARSIDTTASSLRRTRPCGPLRALPLQTPTSAPFARVGRPPRRAPARCAPPPRSICRLARSGPKPPLRLERPSQRLGPPPRCRLQWTYPRTGWGLTRARSLVAAWPKVALRQVHGDEASKGGRGFTGAVGVWRRRSPKGVVRYGFPGGPVSP